MAGLGLGSGALERRVRRGAVMVWAVVLLGLFNCGVSHEEHLRLARSFRQGTLLKEGTGAVQLLRGHLADEYDLRRYYAYTNALLGRPYYSYYVRPWADWQREFAAGLPAPEDDGPLLTPAAPLAPYRDYLVEYPPGFFLFTTLPALLLPAGDHGDLYRILFCTEMALLLGLGTWLCTRMRPLLPPAVRLDSDSWLWLLGAVGALLLGPVSTHRLDPVVSVLLCGLSWAALSGRPALLGGLLAVAIASKGVPLLVAPIWAVYLYLRPQASQVPADRGGLARALAAGVLVGGVLVGGVLACYGLAPFDSLRYHGLRPLQLESTGAAVLGVLQAGWPGTVANVMSYGSYNLLPVGPTLAGMDALLRKLGAPLLLLGGLGIYVLVALRLRALARSLALAAMGEWALRGQLAVLVLYMVSGKVFSPQYLVWLLPLGLFLALRRGPHLTRLLLLVLGLTQLVFPGLYELLNRLHPAAFAVVLLRNCLLLGWALLLLRGPRPDAAPAGQGRGLLADSPAV